MSYICSDFVQLKHMDLEAAREILSLNIIMPTTSNEEDFRNLPDGDLLFYPYNAFLRELYNNASQLRQLMKPRRVDSSESLPKPTAPARKQMKKKPAKAKKQSKTNQKKKSLSKAFEETLKKLKPEKKSSRR